MPKGRARPIRCKQLVVRSYEWFLELPVCVVLGRMWILGEALVVLCVLLLYWIVSAMV